uniref:Uncharacterized protein n=1 Tax=Parasteatoda tepidariorum TaxID=114398 RepID=A0A2L2YP67_PARTP
MFSYLFLTTFITVIILEHQAEASFERHMLTNEPCSKDFFRCDNSICIPVKYRCDGDPNDCGSDPSNERDCSSALINLDRFEKYDHLKKKAVTWLFQQGKNDSSAEVFGYYATRTAVALYLVDETYFSPNNKIGKQLSMEVGYRLLSRLALNELEDVSSTELASFINAFLVACIDVRNFQGINLVQELRSRVDKDDYVNPFNLIALCNAGDNITQKDVDKLKAEFSNAHRELWTDEQALAVMATSCALQHNQTLRANLTEMISALTQRQKENGITDNLKTTSLILQALMSVNNTQQNTRQYTAKKALQGLLSNQEHDGSFGGDVIKTYFVLPVLRYRSLVDISSSHCLLPNRTGDEILQDWMFQTGNKSKVRYSLWLGTDRYLEKTMQLYIPAGTSFYRIMEVAAKLDPMYKFENTTRSSKPYVYSVAKIEDDPESGKFWFLYSIDASNITTLINQSPVEYMPKNNEHMIMWYKKAHWSME